MFPRTLAHYRILEKIGAGGMGEVYLAEDTSLNRRVALKVLAPELAESEERRARFTREAKALAALNHPNIVTVHSVEEDGGVHFITMELVKGKTLAELLPRQGFALDRFFDIAVPLADAVAAAHEQAIVHRDLKPGNVMVTADGRVKVLDFGLAKPTGAFAGTEGASDLPTAAKTEQGLIVGTLSYMSPEQARGQVVDTRSDIFSLGIVFYEMLTGRRPFAGDTPSDALSAIIKDVPPAVSEVRSEVPRELSRMVGRCLSKDPIASLAERSRCPERDGGAETRGRLRRTPGRRSARSHETLRMDPGFVDGRGCRGIAPPSSPERLDFDGTAGGPSSSTRESGPSDFGWRRRKLPDLVAGRGAYCLQFRPKRKFRHLGDTARGRTGSELHR